MDNLIIVTDWEKVDEDDFYLTKEWEENGGKDEVKQAKRLQKEGNLYVAFVVDAKKYATYRQMDADQVFITNDSDIILTCESSIINNGMKHAEEYDY